MIQKLSLTLLSSLLVLTISCTGKDPNAISFPSPLKFTYDASLAGTDTAAKVDDEVITVSQLYSPSPALQELEERIQKEIIKTAYDKAIAAKASGPVTLTYGFKEPKETFRALMGKKLEKEITVTFDETQKHQSAQVNSSVFTRDMLASENLLMGKLVTESYHQKMQSLEGIISRRKILQISKAANISMEDYIKENVLKGTPDVTNEDVKLYASQNNITPEELTEEMTKKLTDIIRGRRRESLIAQYVGKNVLKSPIHVSFEPSRVKMSQPDNKELGSTLGTGPIQITLLSQFQCKECRDLEESLFALAEDQPKYFSLNYVFNFSDSQPEERMIAEAAMCLKKQKPEYFWKFPKALSQSKGGAIEEDINGVAKSLGANFEEFRTCFLNREFKITVEKHVITSRAMGFYHSPVVVIDGLVFEAPVDALALLKEARQIRADKGLGFNLFYNLKKALFGS